MIHFKIIKNILIVTILIIIIGLLSFNLSHQKEFFTVQFGTPNESSSQDTSSMKSLLEIGSQAQENTKYDKVSTQYLGDISVKTTDDEDDKNIEIPDPVCFSEDTDDQINNIFSLLN